jgi:hypothetical protein
MDQQINITEYDEIRQKLDEVKELCAFIPDVTTDEGYSKSKRVSLDVGKLLTALEKKRKEKKSYFLEGGKQVDAQAKQIAAELEEFQLPHKNAYKELDRLKKEREEQRKAVLESRVAEIRDLPEQLADMSSEEVKMALESLQAEECADFYEFTEQALKARNGSREKLADMFAKKLKEEEDARELARLKKEAEERAIKEREEQIKREAAAKAEAEKEAAERREREAKEAALKAEQAKVEAEKRAIEQEKLAEKQRVEAEKKAKEAAAKAAEDARLKEVCRQKEEMRKQEEEQAAREADKKHRGKINNAAARSLADTCNISEELAKTVVRAIAKNQIPNVLIRY